MARRLPSAPPVLPGFSHLHVLGSGGFADVFLYEQNMPRRKVAVKVMLSEVVNDHVRQMFQAEANLMAQLSSHPSILTVYQASVSSDGRPYIVMEFCSAVLSERYRTERLPVPEVLRIAVKIGSAIETAHRAGVLHRDIKPSNILTTAYGHPVLSDFGIASTLADAGEHDAIGMSIPWSAPEVLADETSGTIESEVWAFAATVYSLLAGRSPFEVQGGSNGSSDLMSRIDRGRVQPIARPDVPASLERSLQRAMARRAELRPAAVLDLVHEFQAVESELGVPQTEVEVEVDDWARSTVTDDEDRTRVRAVPGAATSTAGRRRRRRTSVQPEGRADGTAPGYSAPGSSASVRPSRAPLARGARRRDRRVPLGSVIALSAVAIAAVTVALVLAYMGSGIPVVTDITAEPTSAGVQFRWSDPGLMATDTYQVQVDDLDPELQFSPAFVVAASDGDRVCITVSVNRDGQVGSASGEKCVDVTS